MRISDWSSYVCSSDLRVRELAVQSSSGTYQNTDRDAMQQEVSALTSQIGDVLTQTKFNGNALFSTTGSDVSFDIQTGANSGEKITLTSTAIAGANITSAALDVSTATSAQTTIDNDALALADVKTTRPSLDAGPHRQH